MTFAKIAIVRINYSERKNFRKEGVQSNLTFQLKLAINYVTKRAFLLSKRAFSLLQRRTCVIPSATEWNVEKERKESVERKSLFTIGKACVPMSNKNTQSIKCKQNV